jgi:hypothetical protein
MCQISFGILACKLRVIRRHYFGFGARLLTKNEDKAKRQQVGELASWRVGKLAFVARLEVVP